MNLISGRAWVFGDDVNTDLMAPGLYFKSSPEEMAKHCLEAVDAQFAQEARAGDIVVAGRSFGIGSAREQAALAFQHLGIGCLLAQSFGRIFYRNALNFGIPALFFPAAGEVSAGDQLRIDTESGIVENVSSDARYQVPGLPAHLMAMISAGGLLPYLKIRLQSRLTTERPS